jgi:hypothetical protein
MWNCYPWDAAAYGRDIFAHEELALQCAGQLTEGGPAALVAQAEAEAARLRGQVSMIEEVRAGTLANFGQV